MSPTGKAIQLFNKAREFADNTHLGDYECEKSFIENCKGIAKMCVYEVIQAQGLETSYCDEEGVFHDFNSFWNETLEAIEKIKING